MLRTTVYHHVIVSYLEWVRRRGFVGAHIWACPPLRSGQPPPPPRPPPPPPPPDTARERGPVAAHGAPLPLLPRAGSYIFSSRPAEQQVPTGQRLRAWYQQMLVLAKQRGVIVGASTMYDRYFAGMGDPHGNRKILGWPLAMFFPLLICANERERSITRHH